MKNESLRRILAATVVSAAVVFGSIAVAGPASAATGCRGTTYDPVSGRVTATCENIPKMVFKAHCDGGGPFPSWTKTSPKIAVGSGRTVTYKFTSCLSSGRASAGPA
ncbi:hypothetical protein [Curtobacterium sp. APC 4022]|uniref:hypothetical protein n=1 Tax=Curtobacterium sp. APC 4022 TaxID=3035201 RepID=UPI0025B42DF6|nr:hypothetical protein [Curtobacterium sp. APC 4022]MDN3478645.1 hypothetical protein [Curtobacterium sp. APC 4022]